MLGNIFFDAQKYWINNKIDQGGSVNSGFMKKTLDPEVHP